VNEEQKLAYKEKYAQAKAKGVKFYPDVIFKDALIVLGLFLLMVGLAIFIGVANEPKADPSDTAYIPRPEWYFMFLFEMLKYFPGKLEWIGTFIIPTIAVLALFFLPFFDRNPNRHFSKRKFAITFMTVVVIGIVALTIMAVLTTPPQEETGDLAVTLPEKITAGSDLYSIHCAECHGADGEGGEIKGVEGLEGFMMKPINSQDEMYTRTDETMFNIISYGQPDLGMQPFGKAFGGELGVGDIDAVVAFMRYTWDDRAELPQEASAAFAAPPLGPDEVPSYEVHISWMAKRYCVSCHRSSATKENQNNYMETYEEIMTSGDHAPNVIPYDLNSNLYQMVLRNEIEAGGPMPPSQELKPEYVEWWRRWIEAGAPNTAADAAAASGAAGPAAPTGVLTTTVTTPLTTTVTGPETPTVTTPTP